MQHLKDALIGLVVAIVLFAVAEGALWICGAGEPSLATPLSRGFDATVPYLVPDPEVEGGFVTTFSDDRFPEKRIPAKTDRIRVILFGGSNTASFYTRWLQESLDALAGAGVYEVVNLGRQGYGSERVAIILDQAVEKLAPDIVVIYSGHNEFLERGFQMDLEDVWTTEWGRDLGEVARRSRIVNAMTDLLAPDAVPSSEKPEKQIEEYNKFSEQTWEETQLFFEAYRQNLQRMCRRANEGGAQVILSTVIYNRFAMPYVATLPTTTSQADRAKVESLRAEIEEALPESLDSLLPRIGWAHVFINDWEPDPRESGQPKLQGLRPCFGELAELDPQRTWPFAKARRVYKALERLLTRDFTEAELLGLQRAEQRLEQLLALVPDHPTSLFEAAIVGLALERDESLIVQRFEDAGRFDRAPRRGSRSTNEIVEQVAREAEDEITLFDADGIFAERMPLGLTGFEWMLDECHLFPGTRQLLMSDLATVIEAGRTR